MTFKPFIPRKYGTVIGCVSDVVRSHGGPEPASVVLACSAQSVYGYTSETNGADISFAKMVALTDAEHPIAAQFLASRAGGVFLPVPTTTAATTIAAISDAVREHGECIGKALAAMADGKITPDEVPGLLKELDESMAAHATLRGLILQQARAGQ